MRLKLVLIYVFFVSCVAPLVAQTDCGIVDSIQYPVDETTWALVQGYDVPSPRHQGRFHTGADLYGGRNASLGTPVRAIANGRITYSYALGWGRDGGAIIIEHTFPDGSIYYSMYGHLVPASGEELPPRLSCVEAGEVIAAVGDVRPGPHLHFEIRVSTPDAPGAGYVRETPNSLGYRDPLKFLANQRAALEPYHAWHVDTDVDLQAPPLVLSDSSMLYIDNGVTLRRVTQDGRVLWRKTLEKTAVSVSAFQGTALLTFSDGTMQFVDSDGNFGDAWRVDMQPTGAPIIAEGWLLFHTADDELVAVDENRRNVVWRVPDVPGYEETAIIGSGVNWLLGLLTPQHELLAIAGSGAVLERAQLREAASFGDGGERSLLAYTYGGLWRIDVNGEWAEVLPDAPRGGNSGALLTEAGRRILFDGQAMYAYGPDDALVWETDVPDVRGAAKLAQYDGINLLLTTYGDIAVVNGAGRLCGQTRVYGNGGPFLWQSLGDDGTLRVALADQIVGIDWETFTTRC